MEIDKVIKKAKKTESLIKRTKYLLQYKEYVDSCLENAVTEYEEGFCFIVGEMYCPICKLHGPIANWNQHVKQNSHINTARNILEKIHIHGIN